MALLSDEQLSQAVHGLRSEGEGEVTVSFLFQKPILGNEWPAKQREENQDYSVAVSLATVESCVASHWNRTVAPRPHSIVSGFSFLSLSVIDCLKLQRLLHSFNGFMGSRIYSGLSNW